MTPSTDTLREQLTHKKAEWQAAIVTDCRCPACSVTRKHVHEIEQLIAEATTGPSISSHAYFPERDELRGKLEAAEQRLSHVMAEIEHGHDGTRHTDDRG